MSDIAIKIENLSKQYRLGLVGTGTLAHDLKRWWTVNVRGKEDPYLKIGEANKQDAKGESEYVWALRDINLEVKQGEVLGIIGKNGAGKSTLLKILSRVTKPTTGTITYKGRIASLLEVGTGFHPEMTGRENIYMNGAIMGMTKAEINRKLDEIIAFAGVERYIDTPVKRYSSGMKVRLGFAVAAHLEPEILVVDEVLAVGDAEFQKKAIGKMQDVSKGEGRTVLFVSHNMASIQQLCKSVVILGDGTINFRGNTNEGVEKYIISNLKSSTKSFKDRNHRSGNGNIVIEDLLIESEKNNILELVPSGSCISLTTKLFSLKELTDVALRLLFTDIKGQTLFLCNNRYSSGNFILKNGLSKIKCTIPKLPLPEGIYYIHITAYSINGIEDEVEYARELKVITGDFFNTGKTPHLKEGIYVDHTFKVT
jgi:lipopolysaccharide transport system ATP-binding protein